MQPSNNDKKFDADLTVASTKNISLEILLAEDSRLQEAHRAAVSRTINLIESRYASNLFNEQPIGGDNPIVAQLHHDPSRELKAQLHTHCIALRDDEC